MESQGSREKAQRLTDSGLLEDERGRESSRRVSEVWESQGLGWRLQLEGLGWWTLHCLRWSLDLSGPRA